MALGYLLWRTRPKTWAWALIALIVVWPYTLTAFLLGNTTMWAAAFVGLGFLWGWPAPFVLFKPSLAPFALAGIRHRSWWLGLGIVVLLCLSLGSLWLEYLNAMRYSDLGLLYSIRDFPLMCLPVVAWLGRSARQGLDVHEEARQTRDAGTVVSTEPRIDGRSWT